MSLFETEDYRQIVKTRLGQRPNNGYGELSRLAKHIGVSSTFISQVLAREKDLSSEQAVLTAEYLALNEREKEYFVLIVQKSRAGNTALSSLLDRQLFRLRDESREVAANVSAHRALDDASLAKFYSDWIYSAVRMLSGLPEFNTVGEIALHLGQPASVVTEVVRFLVEVGLCKEEDGQLTMGVSRTHIGPDSPWIKAHHTNWRFRALNKVNEINPNKLHYSSPMTLSKSDVPKARQIMLDAIRDLNALIDPSPSEEFYCINVDWFKPV